MSGPRRSAFILMVAAGFVLAYACLWFLQGRIDKARTGLLRPGDQSARERLVELGSTVMLGSFRPIPVMFLWYRADQLKDRREWAELDGVIRLIATVQPTDVSMYEHYIWHMAYNIQFDAPTAVEAWRWVKRAIEFGERGARRNPNHPKLWKLYWQIGWTYYHRCGILPGERARYFEKQVIKEHGKGPFLVAADWFEKAWIAATQSPGAKSPNVHWLSTWAHAYGEYAKRLEEQGDIEGMITQREQSIAVHRKVLEKFPEYGEYADGKIKELQTLIRLHKGWGQAGELRKKGKLDGELKLRLRLAGEWASMLEQDPPGKELQRNVDRSADGLEDLAARITEPAAKADVLRRALDLRFLAADPRRRSAEAVEKLRAAVRPYDKNLDASPDAAGLRRNAALVEYVAAVWARIVANLPGDEKAAAEAEPNIRRYDRLFELLPPEQKIEHLPRLADHWYALIMSSSIDSPLARRRIAGAALSSELRLLPLCGDLARRIRRLPQLAAQGASRAEQQRAIFDVFELTPQAHMLAEPAGRYWLALLRKDKPYEDDAKEAERHLRAIAETLTDAAKAGEELLGYDDDAHDKRDPRSLSLPACSLWQMLHEFNPRNRIYLEQARRRPKKSRGPINIHDIQGPGHEGHDH
ncbi:MAG: hypothetical protein ABIF82_02630 [Planctomycetota bacterium]